MKPAEELPPGRHRSGDAQTRIFGLAAATHDNARPASRSDRSATATAACAPAPRCSSRRRRALRRPALDRSTGRRPLAGPKEPPLGVDRGARLRNAPWDAPEVRRRPRQGSRSRAQANPRSRGAETAGWQDGAPDGRQTDRACARDETARRACCRSASRQRRRGPDGQRVPARRPKHSSCVAATTTASAAPVAADRPAPASPASRCPPGARPERPGPAEAAGTERPDHPSGALAPVKRAVEGTASFSLSPPHTHADTRTEEARVGKPIVPASVNRGTPSTRRERGGP